MIAYTKNANVVEILGSDLPDDPVLEQDLVGYFPTPLRDRFRSHVLRHRLRREIATTGLVNQMVNVSGISYDHRMTEDTGATVTDSARSWLATRAILGFPTWWDDIDDLESLALEDHLELLLDCRRAVERCSSWFLRNRRPPLDIAAEARRFAAPFEMLAAELRDCLAGPMRRAVDDLADRRVAQGVPTELAVRSSVWRLVHMLFDVVEAADRAAVPAIDVARSYWAVFDRLEVMWLWEAIAALPRVDRWQTQARSALRHELLGVLASLAENVVGCGTVESWWSANPRPIDRTVAMLTEIRRSDAQDLTTVTVAVRQLRNLALTS
jgi:glutamate dehydrogenase